MPSRRALASVSVALLLGVVAACTDDVPTLPDRAGRAVAATLTARLERTPTALTWTYTLRNNEPGEIAVFSGDPADDNPQGRSPATGAWVVPHDDRTVQVAQRLLAPPPNVGLYRYYDQFGTVLPPAAELSGSATVSLPLAVSHPYRSVFDPPLRLPEEPEHVVFCIGIARLADAPPRPQPSTGAGSVTPSAGASGPAGTRTAVWTHGVGDRQYLLCSQSEPLR